MGCSYGVFFSFSFFVGILCIDLAFFPFMLGFVLVKCIIGVGIYYSHLHIASNISMYITLRVVSNPKTASLSSGYS